MRTCQHSDDFGRLLHYHRVLRERHENQLLQRTLQYATIHTVSALNSSRRAMLGACQSHQHQLLQRALQRRKTTAVRP